MVDTARLNRDAIRYSRCPQCSQAQGEHCKQADDHLSGGPHALRIAVFRMSPHYLAEDYLRREGSPVPAHIRQLAVLAARA